jgi:hypothetical protein
MEYSVEEIIIIKDKKVVIELTLDEAELLQTVLGKIGGACEPIRGFTGKLWSELYKTSLQNSPKKYAKYIKQPMIVSEE